MDLIREAFDLFYGAIKPAVFLCTGSDPERAHEIFSTLLRALNYLKLDGLVLDNGLNKIETRIKISNAAGLSKDAETPPHVLRLLGFDRAVIGTVTGDPWSGNPRPRVKRYPKTGSLVNWMGLPGDGAWKVAERLAKYPDSEIPLTINIAPTPGKSEKAMLRDINKSVVSFRDNPWVDRFELNISCPNTENRAGSSDERNEQINNLDSMLSLIVPLLRRDQGLFLKMSPDMSESEVDGVFSVAEKYQILGFTLTNTTTVHDPNFIEDSPGRGGASGNALYSASCGMQELFAKKIKTAGRPWEIIACGGINSPAKMLERVRGGALEIQLYTPLIFSGTGLLRKLRASCRT